MPRGGLRVDVANAVHHIMVRGMEHIKIFDGDADRDHLLHRLGEILQDTGTTCFAGALIPNHFHLLRTENIPISTVMRRLLTGYAMLSGSHLLRSSGMDLEKIAKHVSEVLGVKIEDV